MSGFHLGFSRWYISFAASIWSDGPCSFEKFGWDPTVTDSSSFFFCKLLLCAFSSRLFLLSFYFSNPSLLPFSSVSSCCARFLQGCSSWAFTSRILRLRLISFSRPRPSSYRVDYPSLLCLDIALSSSSFFCHRRLPSMTTLTFCIFSAIAIFPTISPFGIDGNIVLHFSPFDIKGKGLNCLLRLPLTLCTQL